MAPSAMAGFFVVYPVGGWNCLQKSLRWGRLFSAGKTMVCLRGESLTHHIQKITRNTKNHNHNIDIKSTQVAGAFKSFAEFALGAGIATVGVFVILILTIANDLSNKEKEALSQTKPLALDSALNDYKQNPVRYDENWDGEYVTYSGPINRIDSYEFDFAAVNTTRGSTTTVICDFDFSERGKIAQMDSGDNVRVH